MDRFSYCSCGQGTSPIVYNRDLKSGSEVCKACAKHDKSLEKYGSDVNVLQYRYPEDRNFVSDMLSAKVGFGNFKEQFVKEISTAYYSAHNLLMSDAPVVKYTFPSNKRLSVKRKLIRAAMPSAKRRKAFRPRVYRKRYAYSVTPRVYRKRRKRVVRRRY